MDPQFITRFRGQSLKQIRDFRGMQGPHDVPYTQQIIGLKRVLDRL